jgi:Arc/MetJ family transcription regulator
MKRRTTIEIDDALLERARKALGSTTTRATVEEALRRAVESVEGEQHERAVRQLRFFKNLGKHVDLDVLASDEMWR